MKKYFLVFFFLLTVTSAFAVESSLLVAIRSTYPSQGATNVSIATTIGITYSNPLDQKSVLIDSIDVFGTIRGKYTGTFKLSRNGKTLLFSPSHPFAFNEKVNIRFGEFQTKSGNITPRYVLAFSVESWKAVLDTNYHSDDPILEHQLHHGKYLAKNPEPGIMSVPLTFHTKVNDNPSAGNIFIANYRYKAKTQVGTYRLILDKNGNTIDARGGGPDYYTDFKPHPNGTYTYYDALDTVMYVLDTNYNPIDTIMAANGYVTDGHEMRITPDGNYIILAADYRVVDMSKIVPNGYANAVVLDPVVQEFDQDKNLIFEWRAIDHFQITDATHEKLGAKTIDFCHLNAIEFDTDSNIILSSRHMDEITKIDHQTGEIIWRWGGKNNEFTFVNDSITFSHQHAIRLTDAGTFTLFDNGNFRNILPSFSRAVEYKLDEKYKIATRIWEFRHQPNVYAAAMGNVERLPNGNTLIGWGECSNLSITEVDKENQTRFETTMDSSNFSYRAYKYDSNYIHSQQGLMNVRSQPHSGISISCRPNPIKEMTQIYCVLDKQEFVSISLYDLLGRKLSNIYSGILAPGEYTYSLNTKNLSAGAYYLHTFIDGIPSQDLQISVIR